MSPLKSPDEQANDTFSTTANLGGTGPVPAGTRKHLEMKAWCLSILYATFVGVAGGAILGALLSTLLMAVSPVDSAEIDDIAYVAADEGVFDRFSTGMIGGGVIGLLMAFGVIGIEASREHFFRNDPEPNENSGWVRIAQGVFLITPLVGGGFLVGATMGYSGQAWRAADSAIHRINRDISNEPWNDKIELSSTSTGEVDVQGVVPTADDRNRLAKIVAKANGRRQAIEAVRRVKVAKEGDRD